MYSSESLLWFRWRITTSSSCEQRWSWTPRPSGSCCSNLQVSYILLYHLRFRKHLTRWQPLNPSLWTPNSKDSSTNIANWWSMSQCFLQGWDRLLKHACWISHSRHFASVQFSCLCFYRIRYSICRRREQIFYDTCCWQMSWLGLCSRWSFGFGIFRRLNSSTMLLVQNYDAYTQMVLASSLETWSNHSHLKSYLFQRRHYREL